MKCDYRKEQNCFLPAIVSSYAGPRTQARDEKTGASSRHADPSQAPSKALLSTGGETPVGRCLVAAGSTGGCGAEWAPWGLGEAGLGAPRLGCPGDGCPGDGRFGDGCSGDGCSGAWALRGWALRGWALPGFWMPRGLCAPGLGAQGMGAPGMGAPGLVRSEDGRSGDGRSGASSLPPPPPLSLIHI